MKYKMFAYLKIFNYTFILLYYIRFKNKSLFDLINNINTDLNELINNINKNSIKYKK